MDRRVRCFSVWFGAFLIVVLLCGASVSGQQRRPTILAATENFAVRQAGSLVDRLVRAGDLKAFRLTNPLLPGRTHERLMQTYHGVPVYGADVTRQVDGGRTRSVFGVVYEDIDIDTTPTVSLEIAQAVIEGLARAPMNPGVHPELTVLPLDAGGYALTYTGRVFTGADLRVYFIDAHTGGLVLEFSGLFKQEQNVGTGQGVHGDDKKISVTPSGGEFVANDRLRPVDVQTYDMQGDLERVRRVLNGSLALQASELAGDVDNVWEDPIEVDGHVHSGWTYDYTFRTFDGGTDNDPIPNLRVLTLVHPVNRENVLSASPEDQSLFYLNAFFCPGCAADGNGGAGVRRGPPAGVYGRGLAGRPILWGAGHRCTRVDASDRFGESGELTRSVEVRRQPRIYVAAGVSVWRNLGLRFGFSQFTRNDDIQLSVSIPHPFFFNRHRRFSQPTETADRERSVDAHALWMVHRGDRVAFSVFGGPTVFHCKCDAVGVQSREEEYPFEASPVTGVVSFRRTPVGVGYGVGADLAVFVGHRVGFGWLVRYVSSLGHGHVARRRLLRDSARPTGDDRPGVWRGQRLWRPAVPVLTDADQPPRATQAPSADVAGSNVSLLAPMRERITRS